MDKRGILYCFNDNGDSLWTQYYKNDTLYETALLDLVATSDSGLLACGQIKEPNGVLKDYIFKTNKNGVILKLADEVLKKKESYLHIYPNPATNYSNIHYVGEPNMFLKISTLQGQIVFSTKLQSGDERVTLTTSQLAAGFYLCSIYEAERIKLTKKLLLVK